jgi:nicotinamide-nucleotide amidase
MKAGIVSIGNELLNGQTTDTNASWLAGRLFEMGIPTVGGWLVPDEIPPIIEALKTAGDQANIVLATGGLGPTDDDVTRRAVADYLGVELELHPDILDEMKAFFEKRGAVMAEKNRSQAYIPAGCEILPNLYGTAPGFWCQKKSTVMAVMPGVPAEMKRMFEEQVRPRIRTIQSGPVIASGKVRCFGSGESTIAQKLGNLMDRRRNPLINCTCGEGEIVLHIVAQAQDRKTALEMVERDKKLLSALLGEGVYGYDDEPLAAVVGNLLRQKGQTIALAESCTGGLVSKMLTDVPGSGDYVVGGWVTYSNEAKIRFLDIPEPLICDFGAVSEPVARAMAAGAAKKSGADVAVGITGIAGPGGGSDEKPVGLVYIGVCRGGKSFVEECRFPAVNRDFIRRRAALTALNIVRLQLRI